MHKNLNKKYLKLTYEFIMKIIFWVALNWNMDIIIK